MNKQQLRVVVALAVVGFACATRPAHAQSFKVGSFIKSTATGSQTVTHNLGVIPKAMIFWMSGPATSGTSTAHQFFSLGFTDGTTNATTTSKSVSTSSKHNVSTISARRRISSIPLTVALYGSASPTAEATFTSWDATNVILNWTTNNATASIIHFIAIGGTGVSAKVLEWVSNSTTGSQTVPGVGFQPDVVFHAQIALNNAPPYQVANASLGFGVMDAGGDQWAASFTSIDGQSSSTGLPAGRGQRTDAAIHNFHVSSSPEVQANFTSMNADGFTVNWTNVPSTTVRVISLALKGLNVHAGSFNKNATAGSNILDPQTGVGFQPALLLLASYQNVTMPGTSLVAAARIGLGAADGTTQGASAMTDTDGASKTVVYSREDTANAFVKIDNAAAPPSPDASATVNSPFDADGFTLTWGTNDAVATEMLYVAMGPMSSLQVSTAVTLESFKATRAPDGTTRLVWRTGYEVDNVGFRVYRQQNGQRVRITSSLVPGTALIGLGRGASTGGRTYTWSDAAAPPDAGPVQYWLEDIDLHGKSTWHGPIVPVSNH